MVVALEIIPKKDRKGPLPNRYHQVNPRRHLEDVMQSGNAGQHLYMVSFLVVGLCRLKKLQRERLWNWSPEKNL